MQSFLPLPGVASATPDFLLGPYKNSINPAQGGHQVIGRWIKEVESAGSQEALLWNTIGDSLTDGHLLRDVGHATWPEVFNWNLAQRFRPGGNSGWTQWIRPRVRQNAQFDAATLTPRVSKANPGAVNTGYNWGTFVEGVNGQLYVYFANGYNNLAMSIDLGQHGTNPTGFSVAYHADDQLTAQPTSGGTAILTRANTVNEWLNAQGHSINSTRYKAARQSGEMIGGYANHILLLEKNANRNHGTVRFTATGSAQTLGVLLHFVIAQGGGHTEKNWIGACSHAIWGWTASDWTNSAAGNANRRIHPVVGASGTVGDEEFYWQAKRMLRSEQTHSHRQVAALNDQVSGAIGAVDTNPPGYINEPGQLGATKVIVVDALIENGPDLPSRIAWLTARRDKTLAEPNMVWLLLIAPTDFQQANKAALIALTSGFERACYVDIGAVTGSGMAARRASALQSRNGGDVTHFGETYNLLVGNLLSDYALYCKKIA